LLENFLRSVVKRSFATNNQPVIDSIMFGVVNAMLVQSSDFLRDIIADIGKILQSDVLNEFTHSAPISASPENEADRVLLINLDCVQ